MLSSRKELLGCTVTEVSVQQREEPVGVGLLPVIQSLVVLPALVWARTWPHPDPCAISSSTWPDLGGCGENKGMQISWESAFVFPGRRVTQISAHSCNSANSNTSLVTAIKPRICVPFAELKKAPAHPPKGQVSH